MSVTSKVAVACEPRSSHVKRGSPSRRIVNESQPPLLRRLRSSGWSNTVLSDPITTAIVSWHCTTGAIVSTTFTVRRFIVLLPQLSATLTLSLCRPSGKLMFSCLCWKVESTLPSPSRSNSTSAKYSWPQSIATKCSDEICDCSQESIARCITVSVSEKMGAIVSCRSSR